MHDVNSTHEKTFCFYRRKKPPRIILRYTLEGYKPVVQQIKQATGAGVGFIHFMLKMHTPVQVILSDPPPINMMTNFQESILTTFPKIR